MNKECLKCGYQRKSSDPGPASECPRCGAIYEKVAKNQQNKLSQPLLTIPQNSIFENFKRLHPLQKKSVYCIVILFLGLLLLSINSITFEFPISRNISGLMMLVPIGLYSFFVILGAFYTGVAPGPGLFRYSVIYDQDENSTAFSFSLLLHLALFIGCIWITFHCIHQIILGK